MTRRSFCYLFGAGLAAAALPVPAWVTDTPANVPADAYTTIQQSLYAPTTATFRTRDTALRIGRTITVSLPDIGQLFNGTVDQISINADGSREVHATDAAEFAARQRVDYYDLLGALR